MLAYIYVYVFIYDEGDIYTYTYVNIQANMSVYLRDRTYLTNNFSLR